MFTKASPPHQEHEKNKADHADGYWSGIGKLGRIFVGVAVISGPSDSCARGGIDPTKACFHTSSVQRLPSSRNCCLSASSWADRLWLDRLRLAQLTQARSLPGLVSPLRFDDLPRDLTRGRGLVSCRDFFGLEKCLLRHGHDNLLSVWRSDASKKSGWIKAVRARSKNKSRALTRPRSHSALLPVHPWSAGRVKTLSCLKIFGGAFAGLAVLNNLVRRSPRALGGCGKGVSRAPLG